MSGGRKECQEISSCASRREACENKDEAARDETAKPPEGSAVARKKDFVKQNILDAKRSCLTEPKRRYVDTRRGDAHDLKTSGLYPIYVYKKGYGRIPRFVAKIPRTVVDAEAKAAEREADKDEVTKIPSCRYVDEEERRTLLAGMKQRWDETMGRFQRLPFLADTPPKAQRKARMERELQQLEKDIAIIEQHSHIYVYDADDDT